jgi:glycolate oxidase FAD binding subunit
VTALRLENFESFVAYRAGKLKDLLRPYGDILELDEDHSQLFWAEARELSYLQGGTNPVWRISTAPTKGAKVYAALSAYMECHAAFDWSGGLIWAEVPPSADAGATDIRRIIASHGGHATLMRADPSARAAVDVFQPLDPVAQRLTRSIKAAFDPAGILNPGRMYVDM